MSSNYPQERAATGADLASLAYTIATEARMIIKGHQEVCDRDREKRQEQMDELRKSFADFQAEMRRMIFKALTGSIVILLAVLGYFLMTDGLPGHR